MILKGVLKHLRHLNKLDSLPKKITNDHEGRESEAEKTNMLNSYLFSVFLPKQKFGMQDIKSENPKIKNFSIPKTKIQEFLRSLETNKSSVANNIPPIFYQATNVEMTNIVNTLYRKTKKKSWREALLLPIYKIGDKILVSN